MNKLKGGSNKVGRLRFVNTLQLYFLMKISFCLKANYAGRSVNWVLAGDSEMMKNYHYSTEDGNMERKKWLVKYHPEVIFPCHQPPVIE